MLYSYNSKLFLKTDHVGILITAQSEFATLKKGLDPYSCGYLWAEADEARNLASLNYVEPPLPVEVALYSFLGGLSPLVWRPCDTS